MNRQKASGWLFVAFPLLIQVPFTLLMLRFGYPDILREPPDAVLASFAAGGTTLVVIWYAYAFSVLVFAAAVLTRRRGGAEDVIGLFSASVQTIALLRWTFLVPFLASAHTTASAEGKIALESIFQAQHLFLGVGLGEHVGQLTLAVWTVLAARRRLRWLGWSSALLFVIGIFEPLAVAMHIPAGALAHIPMIAFLAWSLWLVGYGIGEVRAAAKGEDVPSLES